MKFTNVVTIDRPQAEVFAYLARFENIPRWNYAISETRKVTSGPVGVGTRYRQRRSLPTPSEEEFAVVEFERDRRLSIDGDLAMLHGRASYDLDSAGAATTLTNTMDLRASGPLNLVAQLATHRVQAAVAANLSTLKQLLERGE
ncbi:SRPBCC family protein [Agromyces sp. NPDC049794]|uniref:SRPBCC family protein n=1 Tax=unclassified Agromyces TaxID=2639701 RepID=UPI0033DE0AC2